MSRFIILFLASASCLLAQHYLFVETMINGHGPFRMLVDTGATSCSLTTVAAVAANVGFDSRVTVSSLAGEIQALASRSNHVAVGNSEASGVEILVSELDGVRQLGTRIDGVLGQSFLSRFPVQLDYRNRAVRIGEASIESRDGIPANSSTGRLAVPVAFGNGTPKRLVVDSGASHVMLKCQTGCPPLVQERTGTILTNSGTRQVRVGVVASIRVGDLRLEGVPAVVIDEAGSEGEDGVIPSSLFSETVLDGRKSLVTFRR